MPRETPPKELPVIVVESPEAKEYRELQEAVEKAKEGIRLWEKVDHVVADVLQRKEEGERYVRQQEMDLTLLQIHIKAGHLPAVLRVSANVPFKKREELLIDLACEEVKLGLIDEAVKTYDSEELSKARSREALERLVEVCEEIYPEFAEQIVRDAKDPKWLFDFYLNRLKDSLDLTNKHGDALVQREVDGPYRSSGKITLKRGPIDTKHLSSLTDAEEAMTHLSQEEWTDVQFKLSKIAVDYHFDEEYRQQILRRTRLYRPEVSPLKLILAEARLQKSLGVDPLQALDQALLAIYTKKPNDIALGFDLIKVMEELGVPKETCDRVANELLRQRWPKYVQLRVLADEFFEMNRLTYIREKHGLHLDVKEDVKEMIEQSHYTSIDQRLAVVDLCQELKLDVDLHRFLRKAKGLFGFEKILEAQLNLGYVDDAWEKFFDDRKNPPDLRYPKEYSKDALWWRLVYEKAKQYIHPKKETELDVLITQLERDPNPGILVPVIRALAERGLFQKAESLMQHQALNGRIPALFEITDVAVAQGRPIERYLERISRNMDERYQAQKHVPLDALNQKIADQIQMFELMDRADVSTEEMTKKIKSDLAKLSVQAEPHLHDLVLYRRWMETLTRAAQKRTVVLKPFVETFCQEQQLFQEALLEAINREDRDVLNALATVMPETVKERAVKALPRRKRQELEILWAKAEV
ncbi:hypothetical protein FJZ48_01900 [Candidatus Uhrbacteria bacterium]|nr:hypothetical protein [Candidatus Uhrbacteria bacterium]